ncbi:MAG: flagellar type III secretion system pore protein FliP [Papillibacter sp.]|nr:flagellar type III secretion system pore protein FliP [Papillibacter sp.]
MKTENLIQKTPAAKNDLKLQIKRVLKKAAITLAASLTVSLLLATAALAAESKDTLQTLLQGDSEALKIIVTLTAITLIPSMLIMLTGFTRILIVLSILRNATGLANMPPNMVLIGLALFITYFVMSPTLNRVYEEAYKPYMNDEMVLEEFTEKAMEPLKEFMLKQTYDSDLNFFAGLANTDLYVNARELPNSVIITAFVTSELKHAFAIGFFLYIPFIVIDMIVASTLMAMGMMMLPPAMISLPFKILLFVLVDGWQLVIGTVVKSF